VEKKRQKKERESWKKYKKRKENEKCTVVIHIDFGVGEQ
jgi:hypothetical protein